MGNTGSTHNLHNECVDSELNSYYTQPYFRRTTGDAKKKHNPVILGGWSSSRNVAECKVLPKPTENHKLRATTNGAILQAGGTISFRVKDQLEERTGISERLERENQPSEFHPMRRCHTLILDGQNESISHRKSAPPLAEFRRSQTLLHVGYTRTRSQDHISSNFDDDINRSPQTPTTTVTASTLKVNKYNKKRKAPPAPTKITLSLDTKSSGQNVSDESKNTSLAKPRMYATNSNKTLVQQQPQARKQHQTPLQRGSNTRTSVNSSRPIQTVSSGYASKLPYRREKSFDAILLRQKETSDCNDRRASVQKLNMLKPRELPSHQVVNKLEENTHRSAIEGSEKKKLTRQHTNVTSNKIHNTSITTYSSGKNYPRETNKKEERTWKEESTHLNLGSDRRANMSKLESEPECQATANDIKTKSQQSRIPQLKRTFYFGMEAKNKILNPDVPQTQKEQCRNEENTEESENEKIALLGHSLEAEEEIVDNGILVHVRPTLPRRQPETPSFSPAAAWRNLLEEQQRLQHERSKPKHNSLNSQIIESPICLTSNPKVNTALIAAANWTPQQDLEDEDDDDDEDLKQKCKNTNVSAKIYIEREKHPNTNPLHIFSLSLPRDVHLQCQMKSSIDYMEHENSLKAANCWLVPGFNSLQKFKTHLGKNVDSRSNCKCTSAAIASIKRNSYHIQKHLGETFSTDSKSHQPDCELYKTPTNYHNDNWVLHKSKTSDASLSAATKSADDNCLKSTMNLNSLVHLQPKSLTNICVGKHIVYLPGQDAFNTLNKDSPNNPKQSKTTKSTYKRQRQRQEMVRESLQDLTPIQNIHQRNVGMPEKNTHRFSFQSTVRVLEKRRLAEKLSKDAEIKEAQRLNELEAMKRVEEDFQRKRAPEKANLRNQLRLHLKANIENEEYRSLPLNINDRYNNQHSHSQNQHTISDINNNLFCRAEPDGAVSPALDCNDNQDKMIHSNFPLTSTKHSKELERFDSDDEESETQMSDLRCTALLIEPYLHSII